MKKLMYLAKTIFIPIIIFIGLAIKLSSVFEFTDYDGNGFTAKLSEITFNHPRIVAGIFIFIALVLFLRSKNKDKEFASTEQYGNYDIIIYYIGWILGYTKVSLKLKPIKLQFQLLKMNKYEYCDECNYVSSDKYKYQVNKTGTLKNTNKVNIIIGDTYPISKDKLPKEEQKHYTIDIERNKDNGIRVDATKIVKILNHEIQKIKKHCKEYNLFLATPPNTNKEIYENIFNTGERDGFTLNIFQQDSNNDFKFLKKSIKIKC